MLTEKCSFKSFELDCDKNPRASSYLRKMQEIAHNEAEKQGAGYDTLRKIGAVFVLCKIRLIILKKIGEKQDFILATAPKKTMGVSFYRDFYATDENGEALMKSASQWVLIDFETRKIARPSVIGHGFETTSLFDDVKIERMPEYSEKSIILHDYRRVYPSMLDYNEHLNNCVYADIVFDYVPMKNGVCDMTIEFLHEAKCNDLLEISVYDTNSEYIVKAVRFEDKTEIFKAFVKK